MKRSYFLDLLSYLIAAFAGYYLNSVPIIGVFLSPFILFLLKVAFKKSTSLGSKGIFIWVIWFFIGFPAQFFTYFLEEKYHIVTPITKKYLSLKIAHGNLADHFPININFSKEEAKINLYKFQGGLLQMPSEFTLEIKYLDNKIFQNEIKRLESKSELPKDGSCQNRSYKSYSYYWMGEENFQDYRFLFFPNTWGSDSKWTDIKLSRNCDKFHIRQAAINSKKQVIRYFARPF